MSAPNILACVICSAALVAAVGDRFVPGHSLASARQVSSETPDMGATGNLPEFAIFGWVSPPQAQATSERYAELAAAGFNLALPALDDTGGYADSRHQLDLAALHGLRCLVWDARFPEVDIGTDGWEARLDAIVADYRAHPATGGYYLGDEPFPDRFEQLSRMQQALRERDPDHPGWNNLIGRHYFPEAWQLGTYTRLFLDEVRPSVLCNDHYDFLSTGDRLQFVENATTLNALSREYGIPFWAIVLLIEHGEYRGLTEGELKWQVSTLLAYGARGIGYFTYWTPPPSDVWNWQPAVITYDGQRTPWYDVLAAFNPRVLAAGETLASLTWMLTEHAGSVPSGGQAFAPDDWISAVEGRAVLGQFMGGGGERYLLVANSDSLRAQTVRLTLPGTADVQRLGATRDDWTVLPVDDVAGGVRADVTLAPGDFALLALPGKPAGGMQAGSAPGLSLSPNPARGACSFRITSAVQNATLEILDAGGRRVWARALSPGRSTVRWAGERDAGGHATEGIYFARVIDARGAAVSRLVWLGR